MLAELDPEPLRRHEPRPRSDGTEADLSDGMFRARRPLSAPVGTDPFPLRSSEEQAHASAAVPESESEASGGIASSESDQLPAVGETSRALVPAARGERAAALPGRLLARQGFAQLGEVDTAHLGHAALAYGGQGYDLIANIANAAGLQNNIGGNLPFLGGQMTGTDMRYAQAAAGVPMVAAGRAMVKATGEKPTDVAEDERMEFARQHEIGYMARRARRGAVRGSEMAEYQPPTAHFLENMKAGGRRADDPFDVGDKRAGLPKVTHENKLRNLIDDRAVEANARHWARDAITEPRVVGAIGKAGVGAVRSAGWFARLKKSILGSRIFTPRRRPAPQPGAKRDWFQRLFGASRPVRPAPAQAAGDDLGEELLRPDPSARIAAIEEKSEFKSQLSPEADDEMFRRAMHRQKFGADHSDAIAAIQKTSPLASQLSPEADDEMVRRADARRARLPEEEYDALKARADRRAADAAPMQEARVDLANEQQALGNIGVGDVLREVFAQGQRNVPDSAAGKAMARAVIDERPARQDPSRLDRPASPGATPEAQAAGRKETGNEIAHLLETSPLMQQFARDNPAMGRRWATKFPGADLDDYKAGLANPEAYERSDDVAKRWNGGDRFIQRNFAGRAFVKERMAQLALGRREDLMGHRPNYDHDFEQSAMLQHKEAVREAQPKPRPDEQIKPMIRPDGSIEAFDEAEDRWTRQSRRLTRMVNPRERRGSQPGEEPIRQSRSEYQRGKWAVRAANATTRAGDALGDVLANEDGGVEDLRKGNYGRAVAKSGLTLARNVGVGFGSRAIGDPTGGYLGYPAIDAAGRAAGGVLSGVSQAIGHVTGLEDAARRHEDARLYNTHYFGRPKFVDDASLSRVSEEGSGGDASQSLAAALPESGVAPLGSHHADDARDLGAMLAANRGQATSANQAAGTSANGGLGIMAPVAATPIAEPYDPVQAIMSKQFEYFGMSPAERAKRARS